MVIGQGLKAKRFAQYAQNDAYLIFASGVSESTETRLAAFQNEETCIISSLEDNPGKLFVYFSTASIYDESLKASPYVQHKLKMEQIVQSTAKNYIIFRISQIVGPPQDNNRLMNYLVRAINTNTKFTVWKKATRNLIDLDDVFFVVHHIISHGLFLRQIVNIANPENTSVQNIVTDIEYFLGKKGNYVLSDEGMSYEIPVRDISKCLGELQLHFGAGYTQTLLRKYYSGLKGETKMISIVVPTYYAEQGIEEFYRRTKTVLENLSPRYRHEMIFVNDGSLDRTLERLITIAKSDPHVRIIDFARNFGNQLAITAGIDKAQGDAVVIIDDDLQDPPEVILNFVSKWESGYDVVYGVRMKRRGVNLLFKLAAKLYYRLIDRLSDVKIPVDTGDFRLIDRSVVETLKGMREESRYYRGMVAWTGFRQLGFYYDRDARYAGTTTFTLGKYLKFGFTGITSFSDKPLYFASYAGLLITAAGFAFALWVSVSKILNPGTSIPGWTSLSALVIFFGGVQLLSIGILGLYISKIFRQVKNRPLYITRKEYQYNTSDQAAKDPGSLSNGKT